jgi:hypothetical protein
MPKLLLAVATISIAACVSKTGSPAEEHSVAIPAAAQAAPAAPTEPPRAAQKDHESIQAATNTKKAKMMVNVAKTTQQKSAPQETIQQKFPVTERVRKDGPG